MYKLLGFLLTIPATVTILYILIDGVRSMGTKEGLKFLGGLAVFGIMWYAFMQGLMILAK